MALDWIKEADYAHRGLHGLREDCPENSLAAIEEALQHGYGIEIDIQRSADYEALVFHDSTLDRMTSWKGPVANRTARDLCSATLQGSPQAIPTLAQALDLVRGRVPLLIEIKASPGIPGVLEQRVASLLESYTGPVGVMSLSPNPLAFLGILAPRLPLGNVVTKVHRTGVLRRLLRGATKVARSVGAGFIAKSDFVAIDIEMLGDGSLDDVRRRGKPLLAWTVRSEDDATAAQEHADALIFEGFRLAGR